MIFSAVQSQKHNTNNIRLHDIREHGSTQRKDQQQCRDSAEQLWETASRFVQQTDHEPLDRTQLYKGSESTSHLTRLSYGHTVLKSKSKRKSTKYH